MHYSFQQVDVFARSPCLGNPVAVFLDSEGLSSADMQKIARWTNLSETTFVSASEKADYKVRIFTPQDEFPFAGHPTLGTAWALKKAGRIQKDHFIQECAFGLIHINCENEKVFFELPHYIIDDLFVDQEISAALGSTFQKGKLITTGPRWIIAELVQPQPISNLTLHTEKLIALFKASNAEGITVYQIQENRTVLVRTFFDCFNTIVEDPVCGSGNAAVAAHIMNTDNKNRLDSHYEAFQGASLGRDGQISVTLGDKIKIGGQCYTIFEGTANF